MSSDDRFAAQILETSASGLAGMAVSQLAERDSQVVERYDPGGFANWTDQVQRWLLDLSAAIDAGEPVLFEARIGWARKSFESRGVPVEDLRVALVALRDTLSERLPSNAGRPAVSMIERSLLALDRADPEPAEASVGPATLAYLETILSGHPRDALDRLFDKLTEGWTVPQIYLDVLLPAQREVGRMWVADEMGIVEEHLITSTTQRAMALLCERARPDQHRGTTAVLAGVRGNVHDMGLRAATDLFEIAGWCAINLGPDVPAAEIVRGVQLFDADVLVLAATLDPHLKEAGRSIDRVRNLDDRKVKIVVGGPVFDRAPALWNKLGADAHAQKIEQTEPIAARLIGS